MTSRSYLRQYAADGTVLGIVLVVHVILLGWLFVQELQPSPEVDSEGSVRVQLSIPQPPKPAVPPPPAPPTPEPQKPPSKQVLASTEVKERVVEAPLPTPEPPKAPTPVEVKAAPAPVTPKAEAPAKDTAPAKPAEVTDSRPVSKQMSQLSCRVPKPEYPKSAKRLNQSGDVQIRLVINEQGKVVQTEVVRSSGFAVLDQAAGQAAQSAVCQPYTDEAGRNRVVTAVQPFSFFPEN